MPPTTHVTPVAHGTHVTPIPLATARHYAEKIVAWLSPYCERLEIAGSIRRERPYCHDVDIVCIPKITEQKDMFGAVIDRDNHLLTFLQRYVKEKNPDGSRHTPPWFNAGGEREGKQILLQLPKCQLDLWFSDAQTFGTRLLCRTGSKEHNIWLAERANARDIHWDPYNGLTQIHYAEPVEANTEEQIYEALGLQWIRPQDRERDWLSKHIDSGL